MNITEALLPDILSDFNDIRNHYEVKDHEFEQAVKFCLAFTSSDTRIDAYMDVFGEVDRKVAARQSAYYIKRSYVDSLLKRMYASNHLLYSDTRNLVIKRMGVMALDQDVADKNAIDAAKVFLENTKMPESIVVDHKFEMDDKSVKAMDSFMHVMEQISQGKIGMMSPKGEVIDVEEIE